MDLKDDMLITIIIKKYHTLNRDQANIVLFIASHIIYSPLFGLIWRTSLVPTNAVILFNSIMRGISSA
jgi:hypothetical protein